MARPTSPSCPRPVRLVSALCAPEVSLMKLYSYVHVISDTDTGFNCACMQ
eukprot:SAG22_NODE_2787_length_2210_cov_4.155850_2_plen_50_part_00